MECKEVRTITGRRDKARQRLEDRVVKIICSFESDYPSKESEKRHFKGVLTSMHKNNRQGLFKVKIHLLPQKL